MTLNDLLLVMCELNKKTAARPSSRTMEEVTPPLFSSVEEITGGTPIRSTIDSGFSLQKHQCIQTVSINWINFTTAVTAGPHALKKDSKKKEKKRILLS